MKSTFLYQVKKIKQITPNSNVRSYIEERFESRDAQFIKFIPTFCSAWRWSAEVRIWISMVLALSLRSWSWFTTLTRSGSASWCRNFSQVEDFNPALKVFLKNIMFNRTFLELLRCKHWDNLSPSYADGFIWFLYFNPIGRIYQMLSWQFLNEFYTILRKFQ